MGVGVVGGRSLMKRDTTLRVWARMCQILVTSDPYSLSSLYSDITRSLAYCVQSQPHIYLEYRETSDPSGTAQNEQNNKPRTAPLVPGDQISDIIWRGSK